MSKIHMKYIDKDHFGNYVNLLEIPKYRKYKNKKRILKMKREYEERTPPCYCYSYHKPEQGFRNISRNKPLEKKSVNSRPSYSEYIMSQIKSFEDLIKLANEKKIVILKFIHNMGYRKEPKEHNNYCEFTYRVNRNDPFNTKTFLLNKFQIETVLEFFKKDKELKNE